MAVNEVNTLIHTKDSEGNTTIHYPITKSDNVTLSDEAASALGLGSGATADEALNKLNNKTATDIGAVPVGNVNFKIYWNLQQFSNLANDTATLDDIEKAMPIFSVFDSTFWAGQYPSIESNATIEGNVIWQGNRRRLVIEKGADDGYTIARLYDIANGIQWVNHNYYVETDGSLLWTGWNKVVYASELATLTGTVPATVEA